MTINREEYVKNSIASGTSVVLTLAGTPNANDLIAVGVALRDETKAVSVSGLGATWNEEFNLDNAQNQIGLNVFWAQESSYSGSTITVTITSNTLPVYAGAARYSGVDTTDPIDNSASNAGPPVTDDDDLLVAITTGVANAKLLAFAVHRGATNNFTVPVGQDSISVNDRVGSGSDTICLNAWEDDATAATSYTMGGTNSLASAADWCAVALSLTPAGGGPTNEITRPVRPVRRVGIPVHQLRI